MAGAVALRHRMARGVSRSAGRAVARIDPHAKRQLADAGAARDTLRDLEPGSDDWRHWRKRAVRLEYMAIYRTLADPAYLDPTIDPDDRPLGSLFAFPDPFDANYGRGGLARADDDDTRLVVDVVGPVVSGEAGLDDARGHDPDARGARNRRHRDPMPSGP